MPLVISAQEAEWIIQPIIKNVDKVSLPDPDVPLIQIEKSRKVGLINFDNKILLEPKYKYVQITAKKELIQASLGNGEFDHFKIDGTKISLAEFKKIFKKKDPWKETEKKALKSKETFDQVKKLNAKIKLVQDDSNNSKSKDNYNIFDPNGKLLASKTNLGISKIINNQFLTIYDTPSKTYMICDIHTGKIINTGPKRQYLQDDFDHIFVVEETVTKVFTSDGRPIDNFDRFNMFEGEQYGIGYKDKKAILIDLSTFESIGDPAKKIYPFNSNYFIFSNSHSTIVYHTKSKELIPLEYTYHWISTKNDKDHILLSRDNLKGVWDLTKQTWLIQPQHPHISFSQYQHYITYNTAFPKRYEESKLYNNQGEIVFDQPNLGISCLLGVFKVIEKDTTRTLRSYTKKVLKSFGKEKRLRVNSDGTMLTIHDLEDRKLNTTFHIGDLFKEEPIGFQRIVKKITFREGKHSFWTIIANQDRKQGIIDHEGNTILPMIYDRIDSDDKKDYIAIKKDGNWGLITRP